MEKQAELENNLRCLCRKTAHAGTQLPYLEPNYLQGAYCSNVKMSEYGTSGRIESNLIVKWELNNIPGPQPTSRTWISLSKIGATRLCSNKFLWCILNHKFRIDCTQMVIARMLLTRKTPLTKSVAIEKQEYEYFFRAFDTIAYIYLMKTILFFVIHSQYIDALFLVVELSSFNDFGLCASGAAGKVAWQAAVASHLYFGGRLSFRLVRSHQ